MDEPLRRALDAILLRWLSVYVLAATIAIWPALCELGSMPGDWAHAVLPLFLVGFIAVHLAWRRPARRTDGWRRAWEADPGAVRVTLLVGCASMLGLAMALVVIFCPLGEPMALQAALGIWLPILAPLYAGSVWVAVDCSMRRLGRSADASEQRFREYWHDIAEHPADGRSADR